MFFSYIWDYVSGLAKLQILSVSDRRQEATHRTTTVNTVLASTGTMQFRNTSSNPYKVFVNGLELFTAEGNQGMPSTMRL
ncbi:hypothetical protein [Pontibacter harenae]|uniref:hypothetical protein n=1 Tax=Pontibacter harenae TaxID=2894083 RepID=UPI001E5CE2EF|nr:hypothetical protein [Pontibacter harenae]